VSLALGAALLAGTAGRPGAQGSSRFDVHEATIAQVHAAFRDGRITCRGLVEQYLRRIETFDKNGPALNAIVVTNTQALAAADDLDRRFSRGGLTGPLHCVPVIVKDNFETMGLQSANGSLSLQGFISHKDA
jgi:Asp-tRNA(Asn)/Glu-tRNA(Gln) amidotransferase A subunit family amidase